MEDTVVDSRFAKLIPSGIGERVVPIFQRWGLLIIFALVILGFSLWIPDTFPTSNNLQDILTSQPPGIFIALGVMLVLVVGEFDLSLGAVLGLSQYLVLYLITSADMTWPLAVALALLSGVAVGAINALLVVGIGLNSFIATVGTATVLAGLVEWMSDGNSPIFGGAPAGLTDIAQVKVAGVVLPVFYALAVAVALWVLLEFTVFGREMRATGANRQAAFLSGLRTHRAQIVAFLLAGLLAAIGGVLATASLGAASATSGPGYLLPAFAAAFLGATAIRPGSFNVWGTVIAIFLVAVGITGLQLKGVESWVTPVFNGVVLVIALTVAKLASRRQLREGGT